MFVSFILLWHVRSPKSWDLLCFFFGGIGKSWMNKGALGWFHNVWSSYWILSIFVIVNMYTIAKMPCSFINKNLIFYENPRWVQIYLYLHLVVHTHEVECVYKFYCGGHYPHPCKQHGFNFGNALHKMKFPGTFNPNINILKLAPSRWHKTSLDIIVKELEWTNSHQSTIHWKLIMLQMCMNPNWTNAKSCLCMNWCCVSKCKWLCNTLRKIM